MRLPLSGEALFGPFVSGAVGTVALATAGDQHAVRTIALPAAAQRILDERRRQVADAWQADCQHARARDPAYIGGAVAADHHRAGGAGQVREARVELPAQRIY